MNSKDNLRGTIVLSNGSEYGFDLSNIDYINTAMENKDVIRLWDKIINSSFIIEVKDSMCSKERLQLEIAENDRIKTLKSADSYIQEQESEVIRKKKDRLAYYESLTDEERKEIDDHAWKLVNEKWRDDNYFKARVQFMMNRNILIDNQMEKC